MINSLFVSLLFVLFLTETHRVDAISESWTDRPELRLPLGKSPDFPSSYGPNFKARSLSSGDPYLKVGDNIRVNDDTSGGGKERANVAVLSDGNIVIAYVNSLSTNGDVLFRIFSSDGTAISSSDIPVPESTTDDQSRPSVGALSSGKFIVSWQSNHSGTDYDVYYRVFSNDGTAEGSEIIVNDSTGDGRDQIEPHVVVLDDGDIAIFFADETTSGDVQITGQLLDSSGSKSGGNFNAHSPISSDQEFPKAASLANSDIFLVWSNGNGFGSALYSIIEKDGTVIVAHSLINPSASISSYPSICRLKDNSGFIIAWSEGDNPFSNKVFAQKFDSDGNTVGSQFAVTADSSYYLFPTLACLEDGGFVVGYNSIMLSEFVQAVRYDRDLAVAGSPLKYSEDNDEDDVSAAPLPSGGFVIAWRSRISPSTIDNIYMNIAVPCPDILASQNGLGEDCPCPSQKTNDSEGFCECINTNSDPTTCDCYSDQYLSGTTCIDCSSNCASCTSSGCDDCDANFVLTSTGCVACSSNCLQCDANGCLECETGYSQTEDNKCEADVCVEIENCLQCDVSGCLECESGYFQTEDKMCELTVCEEIDNCLQCDSNGCLNCKSGYYQTEDNMCEADVCLEINNCLECDANGCLECESNYYRTEENRCELNMCVGVDNCSECDANGCLECETGYYETEDNECEADVCVEIENCLYCPDKVVCENCESAYFKTSNGECLLGTCPVIEKCLECEDRFCKNCESGYFQLNGLCEKCSDTCSKCTQLGCECDVGFFSTSKECEKCPESCEECTSQDLCTKCAVGFILNSSMECVCPGTQVLREGKCEDLEVQENSTTPTEDEDDSYTEEEIAPTSAISNASASLLISVLKMRTSALWAFLNSAQIIYFISLHNIPIPNSAVDMYRALGTNFYGFPGLFELAGWEEEGDLPPERWADYGFDSTRFLMNVDKILLIGIVTLGLLPIFFLGVIVFQPYKRFAHFLWRRVMDYKWCFFMRFFLEAFIETMAAALLAAYTLDMSVESFICIALLVIGWMSGFVIGLGLFVNKHRITNADENFQERYGTFFEEFKNDKGFLSMLFYPIFCVRRMIYVFILYFLEDYPALQAAINIACSSTICVYLYVYRPFKDGDIGAIVFCCEFVAGLNMFLCSFFLLDLSEGSEQALEIVIIASLMLLACLNNYFLVKTIVNMLRDKCSLIKNKNRIQNIHNNSEVPAFLQRSEDIGPATISTKMGKEYEKEFEANQENEDDQDEGIFQSEREVLRAKPEVEDL